MWDTMWDDLKAKHNEITQMISEYSARIAQGNYLEYDDVFDVAIYLRLLGAHVINLLLDDDSLYLPNELSSIFTEHDMPIMGQVEWKVNDQGRTIKIESNTEKDVLRKKLTLMCFDEQGKRFVQEMCAQDIVGSGDLAKKIRSFLNTVYMDIEFGIKGEEEFIRRFSEARRLGISMAKSTQIQQKYAYEYGNRGALIRNRVFKHKYIGKKITEDIALDSCSDGLLDYRTDKNFCQAALLHVGVESTGSCGTGFVISEDGYALTCAHVVECAKKEIYATVINGDGYPIDDSEGFEVYDAGDGEVVYVNKELDIALLKMHHYGYGFLPVERRKILPELGEEVVVFGYPLGYEVPQSNFFGPNISFYKGYVSSNQIKDGNSITYLDIDVKSGNSGSPVISTKTGKVIGIISGIKVGGKLALTEKMPYMIPIQHFLELIE